LPKCLQGTVGRPSRPACIGARRPDRRHRSQVCSERSPPTPRDVSRHGEQSGAQGVAQGPRGRSAARRARIAGLLQSNDRDTDRLVHRRPARTNPPQVAGPTNCSATNCFRRLQMISQRTSRPYGVTNGGTFRPIRCSQPLGTVFEPLRPARWVVYYEVRMGCMTCCGDAGAHRRSSASGHLASLRPHHWRSPSRHRSTINHHETEGGGDRGGSAQSLATTPCSGHSRLRPINVRGSGGSPRRLDIDASR